MTINAKRNCAKGTMNELFYCFIKAYKTEICGLYEIFEDLKSRFFVCLFGVGFPNMTAHFTSSMYTLKIATF